MQPVLLWSLLIHSRDSVSTCCCFCLSLQELTSLPSGSDPVILRPSRWSVCLVLLLQAGCSGSHLMSYENIKSVQMGFSSTCSFGLILAPLVPTPAGVLLLSFLCECFCLLSLPQEGWKGTLKGLLFPQSATLNLNIAWKEWLDGSRESSHFYF